MSKYRIDPSRLKMADGQPILKGGQGIVVVGTIIPFEEESTWMPKQSTPGYLFVTDDLKPDGEAERRLKFTKVLPTLRSWPPLF